MEYWVSDMYFVDAVNNMINGVFGPSEWTLIGLSIASGMILTLLLVRG